MSYLFAYWPFSACSQVQAYVLWFPEASAGQLGTCSGEAEFCRLWGRLLGEATRTSRGK